jgi:hypothetical protein
MRDCSTNRFDWRRKLARQFSIRRIARNRLGIEILRGWREMRCCAGELWMQGKGSQRLREASQCLHRLRRFRLNRVSGGMEVVVFVGCFMALILFRMSIRDTVAIAPGKTLPVKMPVMPQRMAAAVPDPAATTAPSDSMPAANALPGVAMGAPLAPAPQPVVDPASKIKLDYAYARERCLARLRQTPQYQRVKQEMDELEAQVRALRQDDPRNQLAAVSLKWITAKSQLSVLTQAALREDPDVRSAENVLRAAGFIQPVFPMRSSTIIPPDSGHPDLDTGPTAASN